MTNAQISKKAGNERSNKIQMIAGGRGNLVGNAASSTGKNNMISN